MLEVNRSLPDHDLGTAHGSIEIDADVDGVASAIAQMTALGIAVAAVEGPISKLDSAMEKVAQTTETFTTFLAEAAGAASSLASDLGGLVGSIADVTGVTGMFDAMMASAAQKTVQLGQNAWKAYGILKMLRDPMGTIGTLSQSMIYHFSGISKELSLFPQWTKTLSKFGLMVSAVGVGAVKMRSGFAAATIGLGSFIAKSNAGAGALLALGALHFGLQNDTGKLGKAWRLASGYLNSYNEKIQSAYARLRTFTTGMGNAIVGAALITSGLKSLASTLGMLTKPKVLLGIVGLAGALAALGPIMSVLLGVADALKQISGAALLLPGIIMTLGIAGGIMMVAFKGIGAAFKAAAGDSDKFDEAIKDLSPGMQRVARTAKEFKGEFKELKRGIEERVFHGFSRELKAMGEQYMPVLINGTQGVATALNLAVIGFMEFMNEGKTVNNINELFGNTARTMRNLAPAMKPIMDIFVNLGVVGSQVFEEMTRGVGATTRGWANFIGQARESGKLRTWMEEGVEGIKDVGRTIRDTTKGLSALFGALGGDGDNALERLANGAAKFRKAMETGSEGAGGFGVIVSNLGDITQRALDLIKVAWEGLTTIIQNSAGIMGAFADGFSSGLISALKTGIGVIAAVGSALSHFSVFGTILGTILGVAAAFKVLLLVLGPVIAIMKVLFGFTMLARGFSTMMLAGAVAVEALGKRFTFAAAAAGKLSSAMLTLGAAMSTGFLAIAAIVGVIALLAKQANDSHKRAQEGIQQDYKDSAQAAREFTDEVMKANGALSQAASGKMSEAVQKRRDAWDKQGDDDAKWTDNVTDWGDAFNNGMNSLFGMDSPENEWDSGTSSHLDEQALKARQAKEAMAELGWTNDEVAKKITASAGDWAYTRGQLVSMGEGGIYAAEEMDVLRQRFLDTEAAAIAVGPAALEVSNGLAQIAEDGASASDKLAGLMSVLRGLGLIESDVEAASMALSEKMAKVVQEAEQTVNRGATMGIDLIDPDTKRLKDTEENARSLYASLTSIRQEYLNAVAAGADAGEELEKHMPTLIKLGEQYGFNEVQLRELIQQYGFFPEKIETIMSVAGADEAKQDLVDLKLAIEAVGDGPLKKTINLDSQAAYDALSAFGVDVSGFNADLGTAFLNIPPGMGPETINKINEIIAAANSVNPIKAPAPLVTPVAPGNMPVLPTPAPDPNAPPVEIPAEFVPMAGAPLVGPNAPAAPAEPVVQEFEMNVTNIDEFNTKVNEAKAMLEGLNNSTFTVHLDGIETAVQQVREVSDAVNAANKSFDLVFTSTGHQIIVDALIIVRGGIDESLGKFDQFRLKVEEVMNAARYAVELLGQSVPGILDGVANSAYGSGERLGRGFAEGISNQADIVGAAAMKLAEAASAPLPRSPAKIGPFSGKGWTPYRGISLAEGFAQGILTGTPIAQLASMNMAQAVADAMDSVRGQFQMPQTSFSANSFLPGQAQYYRDPEISDKELEKDRKERKADEAKQRREDARNAGQSAADSLPDAEEKLRSANERLAKAEESLVKAKESDGKNAAEGVTNAEKSLREARMAQIEAETDLNKARAQGAGYQSTGAQGGLVANKERTDYLNAMNDIAKTYGLEMTSGVREGDPGHHGDGSAGDFSNGFANTDQMLAFAEFMNANFKPWIKELIYDDPRFAGKEIKDGNNVDSSFYDGAGDHTNHVHVAVNAAPEFSNAGQKAFAQPFGSAPKAAPAIDPTRTDLSKDEVASLIIAKGREMKMSDKQISSALATALVEREMANLPGGPDTSTGVFQQQDFDEWTKGGTRNRMNVSDAATSYFEHLADVNPLLSPGQQAQKVQRSEFPDKYDARMAEADLLLARLDTGVTAGYKPAASEDDDTLTRLKAENPVLAEALAIAQDENSTDAQVIQALQGVDGAMAGMTESDAELLQAQKDAVMDDRGIKEYDPYEGALKTDMEKFEFALKAAQDIWGMFSMLKSGFDNMKQLGELMIRGVSNTDDLHSVVDGFQGVASTIGEVASAVSSVAGMVGTIAATVGMAIPGIGQIGTVVGMLTGGIGNVNAIVDLVQDVAKAGGRMIGGGLSKLLGGENGELQGNVKTLLDFNDNTIKSWGDRNPTDRTVRDMPFTKDREHRNPNEAGGFRDLNVFQGQGGNPMDSMNAAMFAVKAHSTGVFAG